MTIEEIFVKNYPEFCCNGEPLSPYWDLFSAGYETSEDEVEADLATVAYMQGAERYKKELAKRAEQIEALNKDKDYFSDALDKQIEATYKVVEKLNKAKVCLEQLVSEITVGELEVDPNVLQQTEQFLKED